MLTCILSVLGRNGVWTTVCLTMLLTSPAWAQPALKLKAPAPNRPNEPVASELSLGKAAEFLDAVSLNWTRERQCGTCHTNYPYLLARPCLPTGNRQVMHEIRSFFEDRAANWDVKKPRWDTEVVATASALAFHDAHTTGKLHPITRKALDRMWTLQRKDGSWNWLKCDWPPAESDDYYGVVFAALGVGIAPDGYAETAVAREGLTKIIAYLKANPAPSLHHQAMLLWAGQKLSGLKVLAKQQGTIDQLLKLQRADGGWSLPSLGDWKRHGGQANDAKAAPSDGYATGFVVYVLRQTGMPKDHPAVVRGLDWLRKNQRVSGRWFTRSLSTDRFHYIAHAGTAYAVMALQSCAN